MNGTENPPNNDNIITITTNELFTLFSIFFISTILFYGSLYFIQIQYNLPYLGPVWLYALLISVCGYSVIFVRIVIYYSIRLSNIIRLIYERHERTIKILSLLLIFALIIIISSILSINDDNILQIIGIGLMLMASVFLVILEPIITPLRNRVLNWINRHH